jgi:hypothetical protein
MQDPELSIDRALEQYLKLGYSENWIKLTLLKKKPLCAFASCSLRGKKTCRTYGAFYLHVNHAATNMPPRWGYHTAAPLGLFLYNIYST